jgi:hypothetical protein
MVDKKSILVLRDSFCDLDLNQIKRAIEEDEKFFVSIGSIDDDLSGFSIIIFDVYVWRMREELKEKLQKLIDSKIKLICFCSYYLSLAKQDIYNAIECIPKDWGWIQMPTPGEEIRKIIVKTAG